MLVPSPNVTNDHQTKNALALANRDAAIMVTDAEAPEKLVDAMLATVNDEDKLHSLSANVLRMALLNSAERIVDEVEKIINENDK